MDELDDRTRDPLCKAISLKKGLNIFKEVFYPWKHICFKVSVFFHAGMHGKMQKPFWLYFKAI